MRPPRSLRVLLLRASLVAALCLPGLPFTPSTSLAQRIIPDERPADQPLELPPFDDPPTPRLPILPPYPIPDDADPLGLMGGVRVVLRSVRFEGNEVIADATLDAIAADYLGHPVDWSDLLQLRDRVTLAYVDRGYATSGAMLPEQPLRDGELVVAVVEGRIESIEVETDGRYRPAALARRLRASREGPARLARIESLLMRLQRDPRISRIDAAMVPGARRGASILRVRVEEASPWRAELAFDNHRNPAIGELGGSALLGFDNAIGIGDAVTFEAGISDGLRQLAGEVSAPVSPWETTLALGFRWSSAQIVEDPLEDAFRFATRTRTFSATLRQPLGAFVGGELETFLVGALRRAKSTLDSDGFSFVDGPEDGVSKLSVVRWGLDWTRRGRATAFAMRSLFSVGLEIFDATSRPAGIADGSFLAWLLQARAAHRLPGAWGVELVGRGELQLANASLLPLEQFSIGGRYSVRGQRENTRVGDNGLAASLEARLPLYERVEPALRWELVPFVDVGHVWNEKRRTGPDRTLASIGLGTRIAWDRRAELELYWGHALEDVESVGGDALQDDGIHLRVALRWDRGL